jgi:hypothetical protein
MNTQLARAVADVIKDKWESRELDSEEVYEELIVRKVEVPEGDMDEILEQFKKAGIIKGVGYVNDDAVKQDGAMLITWVNLDLLDQLSFD